MNVRKTFCSSTLFLVGVKNMLEEEEKNMVISKWSLPCKLAQPLAVCTWEPLITFSNFFAPPRIELTVQIVCELSCVLELNSVLHTQLCSNSFGLLSSCYLLPWLGAQLAVTLNQPMVKWPLNSQSLPKNLFLESALQINVKIMYSLWKLCLWGIVTRSRTQTRNNTCKYMYSNMIVIFLYIFSKNQNVTSFTHLFSKFSTTLHPIPIPITLLQCFCSFRLGLCFWSLKIFRIERRERKLGVSWWGGVYRKLISLSFNLLSSMGKKKSQCCTVKLCLGHSLLFILCISAVREFLSPVFLMQDDCSKIWLWKHHWH